MRQWALSLQMYHDTAGYFPPGTISDGGTSINGKDRRTFVLLLWPYLEEHAAFATYDFRVPFWDPANRDEMTIQPTMYFCPSDRPNAFWEGDSYTRSRGNYVVCFGNAAFSRNLNSFPKYMKAPFNDQLKGTKGVPMRAFSDGLSQTMLMAEVTVAGKDTDFDARGDFLNNHPGHCVYMTLATPNSGLDLCTCVFGGLPKAPCRESQDPNVVRLAARSHHNGGVHVLRADGSAQFTADDIELESWQKLGSISDDPVKR
jgi:hypothetical protein